MTKHNEEPGDGREPLKRLRSNPEFRNVLEAMKKIFRFIVIALSALGLDAIVDFLKVHHGSVFVTGLLSFVADATLVVDAIWFVLYIVLEATQSIWDQLRGRASKMVIATTLIVIGVVASPYLRIWLESLVHMVVRQIP
jgi:hypothetical protein